ncbi:glutaredoxin family protein [Halostella litorea]|uniref:glutaredoxin family protein n=1 Tax=Halostella litorea TaxID=2528831 RepID=UPI0010931758|nr:glutaredoxin family protein [Halostella litorea]
MDEPTTVTVYTREDCHLCDDAIAAVRRASDDAARPVDVDVVDVDADDDLRERYGDRVPYVLVDGTPKFKFEVDEAALQEMIEAA